MALHKLAIRKAGKYLGHHINHLVYQYGSALPGNDLGPMLLQPCSLQWPLKANQNTSILIGQWRHA